MEPAHDRIAAADKEHHAIIARDFSASRMNATKWREVAEAFQEVPWVCRFRWVYELNVSEWMEINTRHLWEDRGRLFTQDKTAEIEQRLQAVNLPYGWVDGHIRIVGYVRNDWR